MKPWIVVSHDAGADLAELNFDRQAYVVRATGTEPDMHRLAAYLNRLSELGED